MLQLAVQQVGHTSKIMLLHLHLSTIACPTSSMFLPVSLGDVAMPPFPGIPLSSTLPCRSIYLLICIVSLTNPVTTNAMLVNFNLTLERVCRNERATFWLTSTSLDHALVVCDLTQILLQALITHWLSVTWPRYFYKPWSRIGCLWPDPDTSTSLDHALVVCDLTQILPQALITDWLSVTWPRCWRKDLVVVGMELWYPWFLDHDSW